MAWDISSKDVWIEPATGSARHLRHIQQPYPTPDGSADAPLPLAAAYLSEVASRLGLNQAQIQWLTDTIARVDGKGNGPASNGDGLQLRWRQRLGLREETSVVIIQQTLAVRLGPSPPGENFPIDAFGAGIRIVMHRSTATGKWRVTSLNDTLWHDWNLADSDDLMRRPAILSDLGRSPDVILGRLLDRLPGLLPRYGSPPADRSGISDGALWVFRFEPGQSGARPGGEDRPPIPGSDYLTFGARVVYQDGVSSFTDNRKVLDVPGQHLVIRLPDAALLARRALVAEAVPPLPPPGKVFPIDPASASGDVYEAPPWAFSAALNAHQVSVPLQRLAAPQGVPVRWQLAGEHAYIFNPSPGSPHAGSIGIQPPTKLVGEAFDFDARSNDFAAVNAYHHIDTMFQMVADFGLPFAGNPAGLAAPVEVVHRAAIQPGSCGDGRCINAQFSIIGQQAGPGGTQQPAAQIRFALADLHLNPGTPQFPKIPLGIATDVRIAWHEFGHALIAAATGFTELDFAHSAGDALAAINSDPASALADDATAAALRGLTYPWVSGPRRRHDRRAKDGWSWTSPIGEPDDYGHDMRDLFGYHREQVLSSTLFRLYRAIGGDAQVGGLADLSRRRAAADYVVYLIVRAIAGLGSAYTVPAVDASVFATALMDADIGTAVFDYGAQTRVGGTVHKVIRWAFEKQGLYPKPGAAFPTGLGAPPPIDVHIVDGRDGSYKSLAPSYQIWNRQQADGDTNSAHQPPKPGQDNFIYVNVRNRGYTGATAVVVTIRWQAGSGVPVWPSIAWQPTAPPLANSNVGAGSTVPCGPFAWQPTAAARHIILAEADVIGDRANIEAATGLPCAVGPVPLSQVVPCDNNLGLVSWASVP